MTPVKVCLCAYRSCQRGPTRFTACDEKMGFDMKRLCFAAAAFLALLPSAASAAARDDVVQGIVRCGAIADDRQWLDCLYGAAQPMRAQLGLPAAPVSQQRLVPGQGYGTLPGYGGMPPPARALPGGPPPPPPMQYSKPNDHGFMDDMLGKANVPDLVTRMTAYRFDSEGHFFVKLSNGQMWRQLEDETYLAHWNRPAQNYVVTIKPGAFGSYNLVINDETHVYKVRRVKT
jgi:hypothetical protein